MSHGEAALLKTGMSHDVACILQNIAVLDGWLSRKLHFTGNYVCIYTTAFPTYLTLRRAQLLCQGQVPSECKKGIAPHPKKTVLRDGAKQGKIPTINLPFHASLTRLPQIFVGQRESMVASVPEG